MDKIKFDFAVFYSTLIEGAITLHNKKQPEIINTLLYGESFNGTSDTYASDYKRGERQIPQSVVDTLLSTDKKKIVQKFYNLMNTNNEQQNRMCAAEIEDRIFAFRKLVKADIIYSDSPTQNINACFRSGDNYEILSELFLLSLTSKIEKRNKTELNKIKSILSGDYQELAKAEDKSFDRFIGLYYIYNYSSHYVDTVDCGYLRIFKDANNTLSARLILGINEIERLDDELLLKAVNCDDNYEAKQLLEEYRSQFEYRYDTRFAMLNGTVYGNQYYLSIELRGIGNKSEHHYTLELNITRAYRFKRESQYKGGLGIMVKSPHASIPKIRIFRMGVSDVKIDLENKELKELLKLYPTSKQHLEVQKDDDTEWWDFILACEKKANKK
ncbi:MAG: hypothetical protein KBT48_12245 [Firmicutes bacterium]|nr:hypothetical protein [Bacillota bacterium]